MAGPIAKIIAAEALADARWLRLFKELLLSRRGKSGACAAMRH